MLRHAWNVRVRVSREGNAPQITALSLEQELEANLGELAPMRKRTPVMSALRDVDVQQLLQIIDPRPISMRGANRRQLDRTFKRGRGGYPAEFYREVAKEFLRLTDRREGPSHPSREVYPKLYRYGMRLMKREVVEPIPVETAKAWVKKAKALGYLVSLGTTNVGALPGPRLSEQEASNGFDS